MKNNIMELDKTYIMNTYARFPLCITSGNGVYLIDEDGTSYLDFTSGIGVNCLGYSHPEWVKAVQKQVATLAHTSNLFYTKPAVEVAQKLCLKSGMKKVFFANSGAEANEGAIKIARKYNPNRSTILTLKDSFHGRTLTTLSATGQAHFHQHFDPFPTGFKHIEVDNFESLQANVSEDTLAIMVEIIQGEGGVHVVSKSYLDAIQHLCHHRDILLIIDEVQTGIGRCGSLFAYMQYDLVPDIVTCAKGLGNGLPIGAVLVNSKCEHVLAYGDHGSTFGGNLIATTSANFVLDQMNETMYAHVLHLHELAISRITQMPFVEEVAGLGLMLGITIKDSIHAKTVIDLAREKGLLLLSAKHKIRLLPPLIMSETDFNKGLDILEDVLLEIGNKEMEEV